MSKWLYPLAKPNINHEEIEAVTSVLKSKWLTMGKNTLKLEEEFSQKTGTKFGIATSNCTSALHLSLISLGIERGDEVLLPAMTYVATANSIVNSGAIPVFVDSISENDLTIDPLDIKNKITPKSKAIIVVHYGGFASNMDEIVKICKKYKLKLIEDCAHSPLAEFNGKKLGSFGDTGCFSFYSSKNMTCGEGGMIVTNNEKLSDKIRILRTHGVTKSLIERENGSLHDYDVIYSGFNYNIDEIRASIARIQLKKLKLFNIKRRKIYKWYKEFLKDNENVTLVFKDRNIEEATPHLITILIKNNFQKIENKFVENKIQTGRHYKLIPKFKFYRDDNFNSKISTIENILTLPLYIELQREDIEFICNSLIIH